MCVLIRDEVQYDFLVHLLSIKSKLKQKTIAVLKKILFLRLILCCSMYGPFKIYFNRMFFKNITSSGA